MGKIDIITSSFSSRKLLTVAILSDSFLSYDSGSSAVVMNADVVAMSRPNKMRTKGKDLFVQRKKPRQKSHAGVSSSFLFLDKSRKMPIKQ
jgi:hypothetical protein